MARGSTTKEDKGIQLVPDVDEVTGRQVWYWQLSTGGDAHGAFGSIGAAKSDAKEEHPDLPVLGVEPSYATALVHPANR